MKQAPNRSNDSLRLRWWLAMNVIDQIVKRQYQFEASSERTHGLHRAEHDIGRELVKSPRGERL
jgi:hypothetical protein